MDTGLADCTVMVTGASGGIGHAIARALLDEGAFVGLHYLTRPEGLRGLEGPNTRTIGADLTDPEETDAAFRRLLAERAQIDVLVVNAGIWVDDPVPIHEMSVEQWEGTLAADLTSAFLCCRAFLRHLAEVPRESAAIVLVGSTAALVGEENHADYAAAKAGLVHGLTPSLKNEIVRLAPRGRVNCICPGWVATPMVEEALADPQALERATRTMALRKIASVEDIARAVVFLASEKLAGHISGAVLPVTGGMEGRLLHE